jgi:hypothetical protein
MEVDPEALIKCTTITPGGVASSTPAAEKVKYSKLNSKQNYSTLLRKNQCVYVTTTHILLSFFKQYCTLSPTNK